MFDFIKPFATLTALHAAVIELRRIANVFDRLAIHLRLPELPELREKPSSRAAAMEQFAAMKPEDVAGVWSDEDAAQAEMEAEAASVDAELRAKLAEETVTEHRR